MGAWGSGLYSDDVAEDIRGMYADKLHRGKNGDQASKEMIAEFEWAWDDEDDAPAFWFALADTQWNYGRLQEEVKKQAMQYLDDPGSLERWEMENPKMAKKRKEVLDKLREKLNTPQPPEKKVSQYRLYHCQWKLGDMYAYQLEGEYAGKRGLKGRYLLFHKVAEATWWPGHVIPVVYVRLTADDQLPRTMEEAEKSEYIQIFFMNSKDSFNKRIIYEREKLENKKYETDEYGYLPLYRIKLLNTSKRVIPKKLVYVGNFPDLTPPDKEFVEHIEENIKAVDWKNVEESILKSYFLYNKKECEVYRREKEE